MKNGEITLIEICKKYQEMKKAGFSVICTLTGMGGRHDQVHDMYFDSFGGVMIHYNENQRMAFDTSQPYTMEVIHGSNYVRIRGNQTRLIFERP